MRIVLDKVASTTRNARIGREVVLSDKITSQEGYILAVKILEDKNTYNQIELVEGRMAKVCKNDLIAGVLGERRALRGYTGVVPASLRVGEIIHVLNLGGVLGKCTSVNPDLGKPFDAEVLGAVLMFPSFDDRIGVPAHIRINAVPPRPLLGPECPPLVVVAGTCMSTGKTTAACEIIKTLSHKGLRVGAAKVTGVSLLRDTLEMEDFGAVKSLNFTAAGVVSTTSNTSVVSVAKGLLAELAKSKIDVIVVELGDGILGEYGVQDILRDDDFMGRATVQIMAAGDPVSAWGATEQFKTLRRRIDVLTGPATDNGVGVSYISRDLGLPAFNARTDGARLGEFVFQKLQPALAPAGRQPVPSGGKS